MEQQQISLGFLFRHVKPGGLLYYRGILHTSLWKSGFGAEPDESNTTLTMIQTFIKTRAIKSRYLTNEEAEYLNKTIAYCNLF